MSDEMKGYVGFVRGKNPSIFGRLIQFFTCGKWTHSFIVLGCKNELGCNLIIEAGKWEVLITRLDKYQKEDSIVKYYKPLGNDESVMNGVKKVFDLLERQYGYFELLGFVLLWVYRKITGKRGVNPFGGGIICSELSLSYIKATGIDKERFEKLDRNSVDPVYLDQLMSESKCWSEIKA